MFSLLVVSTIRSARQIRAGSIGSNCGDCSASKKKIYTVNEGHYILVSVLVIKRQLTFSEFCYWLWYKSHYRTKQVSRKIRSIGSGFLFSLGFIWYVDWYIPLKGTYVAAGPVNPSGRSIPI